MDSPSSPNSLALTGGERKEGEDGIITVDGEERTGEESDRTPDTASPTGEAARVAETSTVPTEGVEGTTVPAPEGEAVAPTTTTTTTEEPKANEKPKSRLLSRSSLESSLGDSHSIGTL